MRQQCGLALETQQQQDRDISNPAQGRGAHVGQQRAAVRGRAQALGERGGVADAVAHAVAAGVGPAVGAAAHAPTVLQAADAVGRGAAAAVGRLRRIFGVLLHIRRCISSCAAAAPQQSSRHALARL